MKNPFFYSILFLLLLANHSVTLILENHSDEAELVTDASSLSISEIKNATALNENIALNKPATQSSLGYGGVPSRAVDGNTNGMYQIGSVTHTQPSTNPWWRVDLGDIYDLDEIKVFNRTDTCCSHRLIGAKVLVGEEDSTDPADYVELETLNDDTQQNLSGLSVQGRYVMIFLEGAEKVVSLAEVEVFGTKAALPKPNVIIVITDDQGYGDLGHTGNPIIQTPALDDFSTESVNLTNFHMGTTCSPSRAGLMTGRNGNRNGVWHTIKGYSMLNKDETTIADVFKDNGYSTGMFGKWHLGDNHLFLPNDRGFQEAFYHGGGGIGQLPDYWNNDYFDDTYFRNGEPEPASGYCTDVFFDEAMQFIEEKQDEPFFCYLSLNAPHFPFNVPEDYYNLYSNENIANKVKRFFGMITNIDDNFARLLTKLDDLNIADNTILIFTTDNGTAIDTTNNVYNANMRGTKGSHYDGGHRVPFIIRWPNGNLTGGGELSDLTAHVDVLPTLVNMTGIDFEPTKTMDGENIADYLLGIGEIEERILVTDNQRVSTPIQGRNSCVMKGDWRLILGNELYNISTDPGQMHNIASQHPDIVQELNNFYNTWWEDVSAESEASTIDLGVVPHEVLTVHDAQVPEGNTAHWHQLHARLGETIPPGPWQVNFTQSGIYKFSLRRWPEESDSTLGAEILDAVSGTLHTNSRPNGVALAYETAVLSVGGSTHEVEVDLANETAEFELEIQEGEIELTAFFELQNGQQTNAYYLVVERNSDQCLDIQLKAYIEGAYDTISGEMTTKLNERGLLSGQTPTNNLVTPTPARQPYSDPPWNYAGGEGIGYTNADYSADVVDWVLVSLRTGTDKASEVAQAAALLLKDGTIQSAMDCPIQVQQSGPFYVVIEHRNHMGIMSAAPIQVINAEMTYDFSAQDSYHDATSVGQKELPNGKWVMFTGDMNQMADSPSYDINGTDKAIWEDDNGQFDRYAPADINLDGDINGSDKILWKNNNGNSSRVPKE